VSVTGSGATAGGHSPLPHGRGSAAGFASSPLRNRLLLVATAALFSTGGAAIKAASLTGWQIACFRSGIAAAALLLLVPESRRAWSWRIAPVAAAYASTVVCFCLANRLTTAANAIYLQSTAPLYLLLLGPLVLRERIRRSDFGFMLAIAAGISLFAIGTEPAVATAPNPRLGDILALASGVGWALALTGLRWIARRETVNTSMPAVVAGNIVAFAATAPMAFPVGPNFAASLPVLLYLGVFQIGLAYFCLTRAMRHVTAFEATTILLLEPALNPVWVWLIHNERPGALPLAGGGVILAATVVNAWMQSRQSSPPRRGDAEQEGGQE
jgi:drug/metabolite transporter, DME family